MNDYIEYVSGSLQGSVGKTVSKKADNSILMSLMSHREGIIK